MPEPQTKYVFSLCPSAMRKGKNFNTHFWAAYAYICNDSISSIFAVLPTTISYKYINYKTNLQYSTVHQYLKQTYLHYK
jgi:hypothetical protein